MRGSITATPHQTINLLKNSLIGFYLIFPVAYQATISHFRRWLIKPPSLKFLEGYCALVVSGCEIHCDAVGCAFLKGCAAHKLKVACAAYHVATFDEGELLAAKLASPTVLMEELEAQVVGAETLSGERAMLRSGLTGKLVDFRCHLSHTVGCARSPAKLRILRR